MPPDPASFLWRVQVNLTVSFFEGTWKQVLAFLEKQRSDPVDGPTTGSEIKISKLIASQDIDRDFIRAMAGDV